MQSLLGHRWTLNSDPPQNPPTVPTGNCLLNDSSMAEETFESLATGGNRFVTFMIYLSSVESGGSTIFTQPGIAIEPVAGNALFWFNQGAQDNYDSRIGHLGCPVLYGNKWIANKWVKWLPQFRNYPCLRKEYFYSVYRDQMSCYNSLENLLAQPRPTHHQHQHEWCP